MKNLHILPTDKPSRLAGSEYITNVQGIDKRVFKFKLWNKFIDNKDLKAVGYIPHNIYITSDEEIKEGDYVITPTNDIIQWAKVFQPIGKKIILTTDAYLIKDGVQAIDDEFLEWFVKNPSCEEVEVEKEKVILGQVAGTTYTDFDYKIIIPKEEPTEKAKQRAANYMSLKGALEPKQETLEEAFEKWADQQSQKGVGYDKIDVLQFGAKWQAERMYSEEEVHNNPP